MKLLAIGRPCAGVDTPTAIPPHVVAELRVLWRMYADGLVREVYSPAGPGAVLVLEAASPQAAVSALAELPLVAHQLIEFEVVELRPFSAFEVLFGGAAPS